MGEVQKLMAIKVENAVAAMSAPLREKCDEVRRLLGAAREATSSARYQVGAVVHELKEDPARYGGNAVELLGHAVGRSANVLYGYASVVGAWNQDVFRGLAERTGLHGIPLSFSHFIVIALAKSSNREALIERALAEGLSVKDVRRLIGRPADKPTRSPQHPGSPSTPRAQLADYVRTSDAQVQRLDSLRMTVRQLGREASTPKLAALLEAALMTQKILRELADRNTQEISRELTRVRAALGRNVATAAP